MKCGECIYWQALKEKNHRGICTVKLPPWVDTNKLDCTDIGPDQKWYGGCVCFLAKEKSK